MTKKYLKYYTPFFCEENCWQLLNSFSLKDTPKFKVLFLSNPHKSIALLHQKLSPRGEYVIWDYHVIVYNELKQMIYDFDSRLPFQVSVKEYVDKTFGQQKLLPPDHHTYIRAINSQNYLEAFDSDRSHMRGEDNQPLQKFPSWPAIQNKDLPLSEILNFTAKNKLMTEYIPATLFFGDI